MAGDTPELVVPQRCDVGHRRDVRAKAEERLGGLGRDKVPGLGRDKVPRVENWRQMSRESARSLVNRGGD